MSQKSNPFARSFAVTCLLAATLILAACPPHESIESINRDPSRFGRHEVTIVGRVVNSFAAAGIGVFEIDDGTGRMWVYSKKYGVPGTESKVAVTGVIQQGFSIAGRNFATILYETRRHS
ncbi:MAG: hypothetical protein DMG92_06810 [Acidobacteria bacterium]|nr:MAG: hypothetical protein DMG92_06810 [Acidobacteriota bacterium]